VSVKLEVVQETLAERYEVERPLGHGGMATVFLAADKTSSRPPFSPTGSIRKSISSPR
jgi:hypothetical protein